MQDFEKMLTGGHPNSLAMTVEVVQSVLKRPARLRGLYYCNFSDNDMAMVRTSNGMIVSRAIPPGSYMSDSGCHV